MLDVYTSSDQRERPVDKPILPTTNWIAEYHSEIKRGTIVAGQHIHDVYELLVEGIADRTYLFDHRKANKAIWLIENFCRHGKGFTGLIKLELWQKAAIAAVYGVVEDDGSRVFREVLIIIARKNGKSLLASCFIVLEIFFSGEHGAEVYCNGTKLSQAQLVVSAWYTMVEQEELFADETLKRKDDYYIATNNATVTALALNPAKLDGLNPSMVINDETHAWPGIKGIKQYDVMMSALGARKQPLVINITTSGTVNDGLYDQQFTRATRVLKGDSRERRFLPLMYTIDDTEKWSDLTELQKSNPNLGVSVSVEFIKDWIIKAEEDTQKKIEFLTKMCNIKQNSAAAWLENTLLEKAMVNKTLDDFRGCYGVGGIDLSQTTDLTAASVVIEKEGKLYAFTQFFMPAERVELLQEADGVPYDIFIRQGILTPSGENFVNYQDVYDWFVMVHQKHEIYLLQTGYDIYGANQLSSDLGKYGFKTDWVKQGENLAQVIREFEGTIKDGSFFIANNNLLKAHFLNVALKHNLVKRTFQPIKADYTKKIDGFVSVINAMTVRHKYKDTLGAMLKNEE